MNPPITDWYGQRVWVIGASSGIGAALAQALSEAGASVALSARRADQLHAVAEGMPLARVLPCDIGDAAAVAAAAEALWRDWGQVDRVVVVAGSYRPMRADDFNLELAEDMVRTNLSGVFKVLAAVLPRLLRQQQGGLALVASVAGFRGLPKALVYGPTKAALINLAESLYLDLHPRGLAVHLINPGFVATPLTAQNDFHMPALITPEVAAHEIMQGMQRGRFHIHFPRRFSNLLRLLRLLPYRLYFFLLRKVS